MKSLPSGWAKTALGEIADVQLGKMLDQAKNIGKPYLYLRNVNVRWGKFDLTDVQSMKITSDEVALFNVQNGDVFVCEGGEPGRCAVWNHGTNEFTYQKALHRVRFRGELNPKLFAWQMLLDAQSQKLINYFTGSTIKHFPKTEIVKYPVLIPPFKEQARIAEKLDTVLTRVDACRDRLARVAPLLKRFRQSVLAAATSGRLTEDWSNSQSDSTLLKMKQMLSTIKTGPFGSALHKSDYVYGGVPIVNPMHLRDGRIVSTVEMTLSQDTARRLVDYRLALGDLVIGRRGEMGRCAVVREEQVGWVCGTGSMILKPRENCNSDYLQLLLSSPAVISVLESESVGSTMVNYRSQGLNHRL